MISLEERVDGSPANTGEARVENRESRSSTAGTVDRPGVEVSIGFGTNMGKEVVPATAAPLGPERGNVDGADDDLLPRARIRLGEDPAVEVDDHASPGPRERRVV